MQRKQTYAQVELTDEVELAEATLVNATPVNEDDVVEVSFQVVSPSDLEPGFEFAATFEGATYRVTVPQGGAQTGRRFTPVNVRECHGQYPKAASWKEDVFGCTSNDHCISAWLCGACVAPCLLGTVMNRLRGLSGTHVMGWIFSSVLAVSYLGMKLGLAAEGDQQSDAFMGAFFAMIYVFALATFYSYTCVVRAQLRQRLAIRGNDMEDCFLSWFCNCCVVLQMHSQVGAMTTDETLMVGKVDDRLVKPIKDPSLLEATVV